MPRQKQLDNIGWSVLKDRQKGRATRSVPPADRDQPESCQNGLRTAEAERKQVTGADDASKSISPTINLRKDGDVNPGEERNPDKKAGNSTDRKVSMI
jgi:hypothetical protein